MLNQITQSRLTQERQIARHDQPGRLGMRLQRRRDAGDRANARLTINDLRQPRARWFFALIRAH